MKKYIFKTLSPVIALSLFASSLFGQVMTAEGPVSSDNKAKVSFELKGMDVVEVLKMLAVKGSLNIVIGPTVQGKVTMFLKDVSVDDAFEIILAANNLAVERKGDIIYVMPQKEYEIIYGERYGEKRDIRVFQLTNAKASEAGKTLASIKTKIGRVVVDKDSNTIIFIDSPQTISEAADLIEKIDMPMVTKIFELNYASAKDLKDRVQEMLTKDVGVLKIEERTNKLIVTDTGRRIEDIERAIGSFDEKVQQVLIDAKIIQVSLDDVYKLGIDWQAVIRQLGKEVTLRNAFAFTGAGAFIPGGEILIGSFASGDFAALIQILKTIGDTNTLSNPRVVTMNNQEAKILVGTNQPYATNTVTQGTATTTTATNLTFIDIGVKLYVTPTINRDGYITMKLRPEVSAQSGTYTYGTPATNVPIISTTQAETNVMVKDGTTIIIAGLIKDERSGSVNKVPWLADLPIIGNAFRRTSNEIKKSELAIFLTPRIISPDVDQLRQEPGKPEGDTIFTMPEKPTFERRRPVAMKSGYFNERIVMAEKAAMLPSKLTVEEYYGLIRDKITGGLSIPADDKKSLKAGDKVKVSFVIYSGGNLVMRPQALESTSDIFRRYVIDAVERASPFPPLPISVKELRKRFIMELIYEPK
ncbi:MAG: secretin N-terminal domain-containing protein [Candidatus Omnitrophica bacterium]|nr:secretin N-terminal domain-containing protein [Candidatus Omnitrophota bacterium]